MTKKSAKTSPEKSDQTPSTGHNSGIAGDQLLQYVKRIEGLAEEKKEIAEEVKEIYAHAKSTGFDVKTMRKCVALRKREKTEREEEAELIDTYMFAMGDGDE